MSSLAISYARIHREAARNLVYLLRAAHSRLEHGVFWDEDLRAGESWREQIRSELEDAERLFVLWCCHAEQSSEIRDEYQFAISIGITVIPVRFDDTPLPQDLRSIQAVDVRQLVSHDPPCTGYTLQRRGVNLRNLTDDDSSSSQKLEYLTNALKGSRRGRRPELLKIVRAFDLYLAE